jgi:hypothetical protein
MKLSDFGRSLSVGFGNNRQDIQISVGLVMFGIGLGLWYDPYFALMTIGGIIFYISLRGSYK